MRNQAEQPPEKVQTQRKLQAPPEPQPLQESRAPQQELTIEEDAFQPSYPESAIRFLPYRIGIAVVAILFIILGQSSLPSNQVDCIQDLVINGLQPVTNYYIANKGLGLALISIAQVLVDLQLALGLLYWTINTSSIRYAFALGIIGLSKVLINVLFQVKPIDNSFQDRLFPSFVFGGNFQKTYFFSGIVCLLTLNMLELFQLGFRKLFAVQIVILIYTTWVLLSMRLNYFMDVVTALAFSHYIFYFLNDRKDKIDNLVFFIYDKITGRQNPPEQVQKN